VWYNDRINCWEQIVTFKGISKRFSLKNEDQYNTIGNFWDELSAIYGLENLQGLGYRWSAGEIYYAIGLNDGEIDGYNFVVELPDDGWNIVLGKTDNLKQIYDEIYLDGPLRRELETFRENGDCQIKYIR
jgi:predicted transcriptional regulator YdeE